MFANLKGQEIEFKNFRIIETALRVTSEEQDRKEGCF